MKIAIVNGAARKAGMTNLLVDEFIRGVKDRSPDAAIERIDLSAAPVEFCKACMTCMKPDGSSVGRCAISDAMEGYLKVLLDADMVVIASPIYFFNSAAILERFVERSLPLLCDTGGFPKPRNGVRRGKRGLVIFSSGAPTPLNILLGMTGHPRRIMKHVLRSAGCEKSASIQAGGMDVIPWMKKFYCRMAYRAGSSAVKQ